MTTPPADPVTMAIEALERARKLAQRGFDLWRDGAGTDSATGRIHACWRDVSIDIDAALAALRTATPTADEAKMIEQVRELARLANQHRVVAARFEELGRVPDDSRDVGDKRDAAAESANDLEHHIGDVTRQIDFDALLARLTAGINTADAKTLANVIAMLRWTADRIGERSTSDALRVIEIANSGTAALARLTAETRGSCTQGADNSAGDGGRVTVKLDDPKRMVSHLRVVADSSDVFVLYGDMNNLGKRAMVSEFSDETGEGFDIVSDPDRGDGHCQLRVSGLKFSDPLVVRASVSRYTLFITLVNREAIEHGRVVFDEPSAAAASSDGAGEKP